MATPVPSSKPRGPKIPFRYKNSGIKLRQKPDSRSVSPSRMKTNRVPHEPVLNRRRKKTT